MLMLALYEHDNGDQLDEIRSWGIDTLDQQHMIQRAAWSYWLRAAKERGIGFSGTCENFMALAETDGGLIGLREEIGRRMLAAEQAKAKESEQ